MASTSDVGTGTFTYQDCTKMESTVRTETWSRPGYSEQRQKGSGTPIDRGDACTLTSTMDVRTGTFTYNGCDKYEETETTEYHKAACALGGRVPGSNTWRRSKLTKSRCSIMGVKRWKSFWRRRRRDGDENL